MKLSEYESVKDFTYSQYCDYLQQKYGIGLSDYMTKTWRRNPKCSRTRDGLFAHHKYEDRAILLSEKKFAMQYPFEWQTAQNIVYCDYLEHLFLHMLISEQDQIDEKNGAALSIGGILQMLIPKLNDIYSGWKPWEEWELNCRNLILEDRNTYLKLLQRFKTNNAYYQINNQCLYSSFYEYDGWDKRYNRKIFLQIKMGDDYESKFVFDPTKTYEYPKDKTFLFVDVETATNQHDSVCAVGVIIVKNGVEIPMYSLIDPQVHIELSGIHHITDEDVKGAPLINEFWKSIMEIVGNEYIVVGHKVNFDCCALDKHLKKYEMGFDPKQKIDTCSAAISKAIFYNDEEAMFYNHGIIRRGRGYGLGTLCFQLNIPLDHHNAASDIRATKQLLETVLICGNHNIEEFIKPVVRMSKKDLEIAKLRRRLKR